MHDLHVEWQGVQMLSSGFKYVVYGHTKLHVLSFWSRKYGYEQLKHSFADGPEHRLQVEWQGKQAI